VIYLDDEWVDGLGGRKGRRKEKRLEERGRRAEVAGVSPG